MKRPLTHRISRTGSPQNNRARSRIAVASRPVLHRIRTQSGQTRSGQTRSGQTRSGQTVRRRWLVSVALLLLGLVQVVSPASAAVGAAQLQQAVATFIEQRRDEFLSGYADQARLEYRINSLDSRLRLADCAAGLVLSVKQPTAGNRLNVHVSCEADARWAIYVPVELSVWQPVVVATRPIARGQTLQTADLGLEEHDVAAAGSGYYSQPSELAGFIARRVLNAGNPVLASQVEAPLQVKRGDKVVLTARQGTLEVRMNGIAEEDGRYGDRIGVRNIQSQRLIEGRVIGQGQVRVTL